MCFKGYNLPYTNSNGVKPIFLGDAIEILELDNEYIPPSNSQNLTYALFGWKEGSLLEDLIT